MPRVWRNTHARLQSRADSLQGFRFLRNGLAKGQRREFGLVELVEFFQLLQLVRLVQLQRVRGLAPMALVQHPGWILFILCVAGVVLMLAGVLPALCALALSKRLKRMKDAPIFEQLKRFQRDSERLRAAAEQGPALAERGRTAAESIRRDAGGLAKVVAAFKVAGLSIRLILRELR
jgi:hypothetical protein